RGTVRDSGRRFVVVDIVDCVRGRRVGGLWVRGAVSSAWSGCGRGSVIAGGSIGAAAATSGGVARLVAIVARHVDVVGVHGTVAGGSARGDHVRGASAASARRNKSGAAVDAAGGGSRW